MMAHSKHLCVIGFEERFLSETVIDWDSPRTTGSLGVWEETQ